MSARSNASGGIKFGSALALLFIGLKLGHAIHWSWWWVLSPLWIPTVIAIVVLVIGLVVLVAVPRKPMT
jgi:predicted tellurium resistance membrane protein TerC